MRVGGGRDSPRGKFAYRGVRSQVGDEQIAAGVDGQGVGTLSPVSVVVGVVLPGANSLTVVPGPPATQEFAT